jgi:hypothetical protein
MKLSRGEFEKICEFYEDHPDGDAAFTDALNMAFEAGAKAERECAKQVIDARIQGFLRIPKNIFNGGLIAEELERIKAAIRSRGDDQ